MGTEEDYFTSANLAPFARTLLPRGDATFCSFVCNFLFIKLANFLLCPFVCLFSSFLFFCTAKRGSCSPCGCSATRRRTLGSQTKKKRDLKKKKNQKLFKTKEKGKCLAQVCGCCVHVPPPITNVTFQLH